MDLLHISQNIRAVRQAQSMTVEQLAQRSGFSKGFISQVENFRVTPSLKALDKIASALGLTIADLFKTEQNTAQYTFGNLKSGTELLRDEDPAKYGIRYFALAYSQIGRVMDPFIVEYTPAQEERSFMMHDTEEFYLLLEGEVQYRLFDDSQSHIMKPGDTLYMKANLPHRVLLSGECTYAKALILYSNPRKN